MIINTLQKFFSRPVVILALVLSFGLLQNTFAATTPSLGAATTYAVLSSTYTNTTITTIQGDVGFTTAPAVTPLGVHVFYGSTAPYATAGIDQSSSLVLLNAQACDFNFGGPTDLSLLPQPLGTGVYCFASAVSIGTSGITLSGTGTHIFRINGAFNTTANSVVSLTGGASACDVFWTPTSATTLGANSVFKGTMINDAGITLGANTNREGRALAFGSTVTTDSSLISNTCGDTPATLQVIKLVDNTSGGTAVSSDFTIHVLLSGSDVVGSPVSGVAASGFSFLLYADGYVVTEDIDASYSQMFTGDCSVTGSITLAPGDNKTCTIINTYIPVPASGGGGRASSLVRDICPQGDNSVSEYDGSCVLAVVVQVTPSTTGTSGSTTTGSTPSPIQTTNSGDTLLRPTALGYFPDLASRPSPLGYLPATNNLGGVSRPLTLPLHLPNTGGWVVKICPFVIE